MNQFKHLFEPIQVGNLTVKNRIALAPMSFTRQQPGGGMSDEWIAFIESVAKGGTGLITVGEADVGFFTKDNLCYLTHDDVIQVGDPKVFSRLRLMSEAIHRHGAVASIELAHGGACVPMDINKGKRPIGPGPFPTDRGIRGFGDQVIPLDEAMMNEVADDYAESAGILREAGFDMVMLHFAHGTLPHQFFSPIFNKRTDNYGGCIENRVRFPLMILNRIRQRVGSGFPLDVRISGSEVIEGGYPVEDLIEICRRIEDSVDMISISCGGVFHPEATARMAPVSFLERGCNVKYAAAVRKAGMKVPVSCVGAIAEPSHMEQILEDGDADMIYMGHALIAEPALADKALHGRIDELHRCLRCNNCQHHLFREPERQMRCAINPIVGHEQKNYDSSIPAKSKKTVLIAGGGPAGMQAALTAADRGHRVILCEKEERLGGALWFCEDVAFKSDVKVYMDRVIKRTLNDPSIEVRLNTEVTPEYAAIIGADAVFAAIGSEHIIPPIPGVDGKNVMTAKHMFQHMDDVGENVVVIGGGLVGCETAIHLGQNGRKVTLLEMTPQLAVDANQSYGHAIHENLDKYTVQMPSCKCLGIDEGCVQCERDGQPVTLAADTVILAVGMRENNEEAWKLRPAALEFSILGDCNEARRILEAVHDGFFAAMDL